ncbi:MAG: monovalent cation/H+ antiporter subunit A [Burkholderiales bacterium]
MTLALIILLPLVVGAAAALVLKRRGLVAVAVACGAVTLAALVLVVWHAMGLSACDALVQSLPWLPELGLNLSFRLDGLALLLALLIRGIGLLVILYARYYFSEEEAYGRFYALLMVFMATMLGIVLSENVLLLVVFWELTSLLSFLLIGFKSHAAQSRQGARMAIAVTGGGGLALLAGMLLLGTAAGSFELSDLLAAGATVKSHPYYTPALLLILLGAFTKSAQFPFHFWLPEAMAAPTPVSAYLHSATMVKAGVFLIARLYPVLGGTALFEYTVSTVGLVTMVYGAYVAVFRHDIKGLLAYSTISHLGLIMFLLGLDSPTSAVAAVFHIVNHATFKASLFMAAGIIDHETGTRDMRRLNGLWRYMPHTAALAMVAAAAMAGVPLFNGFLSKEMFFAEALELRNLRVLGTVAPVAVTLGGIFSVAYSMRFIHDVFFHGDGHGLPRTPHEPPRYMKVPVEILVLVVIAVGILPAFTVAPLLDLVAPVVLGGARPEYSLELWHGFTPPLAMSAIALAGGSLMYWLLQRKYNLHLHVPAGFTARLLFQHAMDRAVEGAAWITRTLENGSLQRYLALLLGGLMVLGVSPFIAHGLSRRAVSLTPATPLAAGIAGIAIVAAIAAIRYHHERFVAVILAGVVGLSAAITFAYFSAPDLALTQLSVEVVTTVLLLMALALLPQSSPRESTLLRKARDAALALGSGSGVAAFAWAALTRPHESISWYFLEQSVPKAGGSNVVNVILVDFRGFDTFGEIAVLGIAALGAWMLMERVHMARPAATGPTRNPLMLTTAARVLLPFALLIAVYIFLRGHDQPGGGFIAGLIAAAALVMQYMGEGLQATLARMRVDFAALIGGGVLLAGVTGAASMLAGAPFLTSAHGYLHAPLLGEIPIASALAFDLGVFMAVVGATMLSLTAIAQAGVRPAGTSEVA